MIGRKGFFDYVMCAADGTRLKQQLWGLKHPLFSTLDEKQNILFNIINSDYLDDLISKHNYFPIAIGADTQRNLLSYALDATFDSTMGSPSVELTFTNDDGDYTSTIEYTHSNSSEPTEDSSDIEVGDTINVDEGTNDNDPVQTYEED